MVHHVNLENMTYFPNISIQTSDSHNVDAFGRLRVGTPQTLFDSKQTIDDRSIYWDTKLVLGATSSYVRNRASTTLSVSATTGSTAIRQSKTHASYQPGKSLHIVTTQVFGPTLSGIRRRVGMFDDRNGIFVQTSGSTTSIVLRSSTSGTPVDTRVDQNDWNIDKLDGTGVSRITLDMSKVNIIETDLQWLGSGRVRVGFEFAGITHYAHQFLASNIGTSVYMSTPDLPVRYEISNVSSATTGTLEQICSSITSEGGYEPKNLQFGVDRSLTVLSGVTSAGQIPLISIRTNPSYTGSFVLPTGGSMICTTTATSGFRWSLLLNPTIAGTDNVSWTNVLSSSVQYDINRNASNVATNGIKITSGYSVGNQDFGDLLVNTLNNLGSTIDGRPDEVVLCVQLLGVGTDSFLGSLTWEEFT